MSSCPAPRAEVMVCCKTSLWEIKQRVDLRYISSFSPGQIHLEKYEEVFAVQPESQTNKTTSKDSGKRLNHEVISSNSKSSTFLTQGHCLKLCRFTLVQFIYIPMTVSTSAQMLLLYRQRISL